MPRPSATLSKLNIKNPASHPFGMIVVLLAVMISLPCQAKYVFTETFDTDTNSTEETLQAYPRLSLSPPALGVIVKDGVLITQSGSRMMISLARLEPGPAEISLDIGATDDSRGSSIVVLVREARIVFHPGWSSGGGFRVDGVFHNQNMGFIPRIGVIHHLKIRTDGKGHFDIEFIDGDNPDNVYEVSFYHPKTKGNEVALYSANRALIIDNIRIDSVLPFEVDITDENDENERSAEPDPANDVSSSQDVPEADSPDATREAADPSPDLLNSGLIIASVLLGGILLLTAALILAMFLIDWTSKDTKRS